MQTGRTGAVVSQLMLSRSRYVELGNAMFPPSVTCNQCWKTAKVVAWMPTAKVANHNTGAGEDKAGVNCRIDCPTCGTRVQKISTAIE